MSINYNKIFFLLLLIMPLSIVIGPSLSLTNMILIILLYFLIFVKSAHYKFLYKDKTVQLLFAIYIYLIINSLISLDHEIGFKRNFGFIRLIFFFIAINYFFYISEKNIKVLNIWTILFIVFAIDIYIERFSGTNIFGWGGSYGKRVVSFFKDEPIVGGYLNGFIFLILGYLLTILKNKKKTYLPLALLFSFFLIAILITGERANFIKTIFGIILFLSVLDFVKLKIKILIFLLLIGSVILTISNSDYLKNRYYGQLYREAFIEKDSKFFKENTYIKLYQSGFKVFKNSPLFGVGNKNYRVETCSEKALKFDYYCLTHPHQIYLEFLSEHGLIGTIILLSLFFTLIFKNLKVMILSQNYIQIGAFTYLIFTFLPLVPSGSFFADFNITLFFLNFSLMYGVSKNSNIFLQKKNLQ